ncbi:ATP-dependent DNA helicase 2 subunit KU80-like isoform X2 [Eucalyptus grandis]|uniref:ATP-dependent DNA helicase 2 subunit KU80-like isoform X2 n=1 Tax=Eucalyptus grandis TaxID=71139 RepID=UPI0008A0B3BD|nr:ATP-dependent DNA helicase 2 subunit KU80-like isoform X2 [Eucalyptus grandis]
MLDLAPSDRKEMLQPDFTPNLVLEELKQFNDFLHQLYKFCLQNDLRSFCDFLATKVFTLISKTKATDSDVTKEEARSFLVKKRAEARMRI